MSSKDQPTQSDIQPEGGYRPGRVTDDTETTDAEGHLAKAGRATEPVGIEPEGGLRYHPLAEEPDTEGHVITFGLDTKPGVKVDGAIDTDVEGHMPLKRGLTDDADIGPDQATKFRPYTEDDADDADDAEGHVVKGHPFTEPTGIEPEGTIKFRPYTEGDETTGIEPDGGATSKH